mgnify:CR=1 FL=1
MGRWGPSFLQSGSRRFPQTAYAGLTKSLQSEWIYLQRVVPDIAESFAPLEKVLAEEFIPALFGGEDAPSREISQLPVRFAKMTMTKLFVKSETTTASTTDVQELLAAQTATPPGI